MPSGIEAALQGRIGTDPQAKTTGAGKPWLSLRVAVGKDDDTQWVSIAYFHSDAHDLAGRLSKGQEIYAEGRMTLRTWEKDGATRSGLDLSAWRVEPLGEIGKRRRPRERRERARSTSTTTAPRSADFHNDEIPF